ncbi:hypothetical protein HMPREF0578_1973 [Mobiluncus mulieris 28-1]|uniref:Ferritin-like domain-containing protein n=1 Tax=Mobiluncus mulieris TaxID=2052 RepID=A0A7Y0U1T7_9ACTO|nr:ferritin-like fold-containing protein [Mobiluncus mulieris]EEZ90970.1 hypothetical protein HMPREF0578_1973 [Mobiluncus mulieris 28-1]MCU9969122.1 hypothetical protein [Mobiluncus mulieris]NMW64873.1 hypothetical protein [Mobiluncus mulieris]NMW75383.1 hypothetical protein [Mobiluncus mulieris]NMX19735.1 hypothetical protein [Mobiluncus mulieris]
MDNTSASRDNLLGLVAFARITAYARLARDVSQTTNFTDQLTLARMGVSFVTAIDDLEAFATRRNLDLAVLTQPFVGFFDDMEARTRPRDWWERMVKSYVFVGVLVDLESIVGEDAGADLAGILGVTGATGHAPWVRSRLSGAISEDPTLAARLSMWGRRVAGETLAGVKNLLEAYPDLIPPQRDVREIADKITTSHSRRMQDLGLTY